jgi:quinoprotein relay system zinc metallohydrolase 2
MNVTDACDWSKALVTCTASKLVTRRHALLGALCSGCMAPFASVAARTPDPLRFASRIEPRFEQVAGGIFIRTGLDEDATAANADAIANVGFIVGRKSVATMDAGGSLEDGKRLRAAIRSHTSLPISHVILSHAHPDHVFGAAAFVQDKPQFVGHSKLPRALALRGDYYRARLESQLGKARAGTAVTPTLLVETTRDIDLGGRVLTVKAHSIAHTDNDLSVLDGQTGTLLASDLLFVRRVPALDGSLRGWLNELQVLKGLPARRAVPGHGPAGVDWPTAAVDLERYLTVLLTETRAAIAKGTPIEEAVKVVGQSERTRWMLFDDYHGRNVTQAFKELEWE